MASNRGVLRPISGVARVVGGAVATLLAPDAVGDAHQRVKDLGAQVVGIDAAAQFNRHAHLLDVRRTRVTRREVALQSTAVTARQPALEVFTDEPDRVTAIDIPDPRHQRTPLEERSNSSHNCARARRSTTLTFACENPINDDTSRVVSPSTSRNVTTDRCASGNAAIASLKAAAAAWAWESPSARRSAKERGGSLHTPRC